MTTHKMTRDAALENVKARIHTFAYLHFTDVSDGKEYTAFAGVSDCQRVRSYVVRADDKEAIDKALDVCTGGKA